MKTMLVTGATSGIGKALVTGAHKAGWHVIACGRNEQSLAELAQMTNVSTLRFDVTDLSDVENAISKADAFDVAVLNAGVCEYVDLDAFDVKMFERVFAANFFGVVNCVQALLPRLKSGNKLVIVDSLARQLPFTRSQAYGSSKAALHYFTKTMAVDLAHRNVDVVSVSPGFVETPLTDKNDFEMPMRISSDKAAKALLDGIEGRNQAIYFPWSFAMILRFLTRLPDSAKLWLGKKLKQSNTNKD